MNDRILAILGGFRRRLVVVRAVEAGAVGGTAGALSAAALMAGWTLAGKFTTAAALLCALPLAAGWTLAISTRLANRLHSERSIRWFIIILLTVCGLAGTVCILTGTYVYLPKNRLFLILPVGALLSSVIVLIRGATLRQVAVLVDRQKALRERLSTALELMQSDDHSPFAQAVRLQALAATGKRDFRRVSFWNRTRATGGALGLAVIAAAVMLAVEPLESLSAKQQRRWVNVSSQAGEEILKQLTAAKAQRLDNSTITEQIRRLERLAGTLRRAGKPGDAKQWRGKVIELDEIAGTLRRAVNSGEVGADASERIGRLIDAIERESTAIAEGMAGSEYAGAGAGTAQGWAEGPQFTPPARTEASWAPLTVYNPLYAPPAESAGTATATGEVNSQVPYDRAWADARRRAAGAMDKAAVPAEYRRLIREFFDTDR